eukprot:1057368-Prymnesium_polylepis.1
MVSTGKFWERGKFCVHTVAKRIGLRGAAMQGGGGLRRAAPCASRSRGHGTWAGGWRPGWRFGRGAAESRAAWDRPGESGVGWRHW